MVARQKRPGHRRERGHERLRPARQGVRSADRLQQTVRSVGGGSWLHGLGNIRGSERSTAKSDCRVPEGGRHDVRASHFVLLLLTRPLAKWGRRESRFGPLVRAQLAVRFRFHRLRHGQRRLGAANLESADSRVIAAGAELVEVTGLGTRRAPCAPAGMKDLMARRVSRAIKWHVVRESRSILAWASTPA